MTVNLETDGAFLHDAVVSEIKLLIDDQGNRRLCISADCHLQCGNEVLAGQTLDIELIGTLVLHGDLFGYVSSPETIDSFDFRPSPRLSSTVSRLTAAGMLAPECTVSIGFHSGSELEVACREVVGKIRQATRVS